MVIGPGAMPCLVRNNDIVVLYLNSIAAEKMTKYIVFFRLKYYLFFYRRPPRMTSDTQEIGHLLAESVSE